MIPRVVLKRSILAVWLLVALVAGAPLLAPAPAGAAPRAAEAAPARALAAPLASVIDSPGHHFGFSQASVLAQATATTVPGSTVPCANVAGQTCTVTANGANGSVTGSGTVTPTGAMSFTLTASIPTGFPGAPVVPAGSIPVASFTTITGTQTFQCAVVSTIPGANQTTCIGTTTSPAVQGSQVIVTFAPGAVATGIVNGPGAVVVGPGNPPASSGQAGVPCTGVVGGSCTISGTVSGTFTKTGSGPFTVTASGPTTTAPGGIPQVFLPTTAGVESFACSAVPVTAPFTTTCTGTLVGDLLQGANVTVRFPLVGGGTTDVTGTVVGPGVTPTPGASLTPTQALALVALSGQANVPCALIPGDTCQVAGAVTGSGRVTGSMLWTLTATVPAGVAAGVVPVAVFSTTSLLEAITCTAVVAGVATVTCTGTTVGNALQGSTVTVVFAVGVVATGTVNGPGIPLIAPPALALRPPPVEFFPPSMFQPPPLLPPPPSAPSGMTVGGPGGRLAAEVPVVPEADSVILVAGGLLALGAIAALRSRRRGR